MPTDSTGIVEDSETIQSAMLATPQCATPCDTWHNVHNQPANVILSTSSPTIGSGTIDAVCKERVPRKLGIRAAHKQQGYSKAQKQTDVARFLYSTSVRFVRMRRVVRLYEA